MANEEKEIKLEITNKNQKENHEAENTPSEKDSVQNDQTPLNEKDDNEDKKIITENSLQEITHQISSLLSFVEKVDEGLKLRNERDRYKDEAILRMGKQIETYEKGLIKKIKEPVIKDIILLYDSLEKFEKKFSNLENANLNYEVSLLIDEVDEILFTNDVEKIELDMQPQYDRKFQKVKRTISTDSIEEDLQVIEVIKSGFTWGDKVLRKQEIVTKKYYEPEKIENEK